MTPSDVYFDLDGTLTDPFQGITLSIQHALRGMQVHVPEQRELAPCIGPPLRESFARLIGTNETAHVERAVALYRERYSVVGLFENEVYEGVVAMLQALAGRGHRLFMATSKPRVFAERIAVRFELDRYFTQIFGSELDGRFDDKRELLQYALATHAPRGRAVMVGDRAHDVRGAKANGLYSIGVSYGYGGDAELSEAGVDSICKTPHEIAACVAAANA